MVKESIDACDVDIRKEMYATIVLTGANTLYPGFSGRLANELNKNISPAFRVKVSVVSHSILIHHFVSFTALGFEADLFSCHTIFR